MMAFRGIKKRHGQDFNFFEKRTVSWTQFGAPDGYTIADGYGPDMVITFPTYGLIFLNEGSTNVIEYSFNGTTVHGELDSNTGSLTKMLTFNDRPVSLIWFRLKSGSAGVVSVQAWGTR
jgi:hypothetical protein